MSIISIEINQTENALVGFGCVERFIETKQNLLALDIGELGALGPGYAWGLPGVLVNGYVMNEIG